MEVWEMTHLCPHTSAMTNLIQYLLVLQGLFDPIGWVMSLNQTKPHPYFEISRLSSHCWHGK
jgi:hypothetical protein